MVAEAGMMSQQADQSHHKSYRKKISITLPASGRRKEAKIQI